MVQQNRKNCDWMTFRKYSATMWELQAELKISGHFSPQRSRRGTWYLQATGAASTRVLPCRVPPYYAIYTRC
jgi:hypothetical protein